MDGMNEVVMDQISGKHQDRDQRARKKERSDWIDRPTP